MKPSNSFAKSAFDRIFGVIGFVLLSPFLAVIALLVRLTSPGPVLFLQERVGKNGKPFRIMKFRTMVEGAEEMGLKITVGNDARVTRVGETLRKFKLDELPQILKIGKGAMSFVGP